MLKKVYHVLFDRGHIENCGSLNFVRQLMIHLLGYYVIWVFSSQTWKWENQVKEPVHNKDFILSFLPIVSFMALWVIAWSKKQVWFQHNTYFSNSLTKRLGSFHKVKFHLLSLFSLDLHKALLRWYNWCPVSKH